MTRTKTFSPNAKKIAITGGTVAAIATLIMGVAAANKSCNKSEKVVATTTTSTLGTTTASTTLSTSESTKNTTKYSVETLDIDYSSPTRSSDEIEYFNEYGEDGEYIIPDDTITVLRETTPPDTVTVLEEGTFDFEPTEPVSYETTAVETNVEGVRVDDHGEVEETTTYIEPTGNDTLPVEPTNQTIDLSALCIEPKYGKVLSLKLR